MAKLTVRNALSGAERLAERLASFGVTCVFGVPGSQNTTLFDALERCGIRTILTTSETSAGFMANGWHRASGELGVFLGISGPGFSFAIPALAEAALDSSAVMMITGSPPDRGRLFDLQWLDQRSIASALACQFVDINSADAVAPSINDILRQASEGACRPIVVQVSKCGLESIETNPPAVSSAVYKAEDVAALILPADFVTELQKCRRPLVFVGSDVIENEQRLSSLVRRIGAAVITTPFARGILPESNDQVISADFLCDDIEELNRFIAECDLVLGIGCRLSHNGTGGFGVSIPDDRFFHSHQDAAVLSSNYKARWVVEGPSLRILESLNSIKLDRDNDQRRGWQTSELSDWKARIVRSQGDVGLEPQWPGVGVAGWQPLIDHIRAALPDDAILVTDTGNHQIYTRKYYEVRSERGLIFPQDFQSMGFGIPGSIGAAVAAPDRPVVALVGDGAFSMTALELTTVIREQVPLVVIVVNDGWLSQIRHQQAVTGLSDKSSKLRLPDIKTYADAVGVRYMEAGVDLADQLRNAIQLRKPALIEIRAKDSEGFEKMKSRADRKRKLMSALGSNNVRRLKSMLRRN